MVGTYEYSDFPMTPENGFDVKRGDHIPGHVIHEYLKRYAQEFGVLKLCRFSEEVKVAEKVADGWSLVVERTRGQQKEFYELKTKKLVVSTGLLSETFLPTFEGMGDFGAPIFHCANLLQYSDNLFKTAKNVVIFGGTKSAWDAAYAFAIEGIHVDWVIRESGHGPCWMAPPYVTPFKKWLEKLVTTRLLTWFSPCIWGDADGFTGVRGFLNRTAFGRMILKGFWGILASDVMAANGYDKHPETAKLKPWVDAFWIATGLSIFNYPTDFLELVRSGKISVHINDIARLESRTVRLSPQVGKPETGDLVIEADALICSTGWKSHPPMRFLDNGIQIDAELGLPYYSDKPESDDKLLGDVDKEIFSSFPVLQKQPQLNLKMKPLPGSADVSTNFNRPFRLYRFMVPPAFISDRSIVFNGMNQSACTTMIAQAQALWLTAYFGGKLKISSEDPATLESKITRETVLHSRFGKWRYPGGYGAKYPDFMFDALPYLDLLLGEVGVKSRRKKGLFQEILQPYGPEDYVGLVDEWRMKNA